MAISAINDIVKFTWCGCSLTSCPGRLKLNENLLNGTRENIADSSEHHHSHKKFHYCPHGHDKGCYIISLMSQRTSLQTLLEI
jgi:hypothetical protein